MKVLAVRRHPAQSASDPLIDGVYAPDGLREMLALCDYVLVAAPNTPETNGMIGEAELRAMKPEAVLINLGRGPVIDEAALIAALEERRIKGAALDVFNQEPLPEGHAFYGLDNVLLSPHCADHTPGWLDESMQFFVDNFGRFVSGEPLQNLVNKVEKARAEGDLFMKDYFLSERSAYSTLVAELTEVAGKAKIKIKDHSFTEEPIEGAEHLKMLSISANYEGTYADLVEFVNMLDRSPRFLIIENLTATPQQSGGALNINIRLDTFMRAGEVAP